MKKKKEKVRLLGSEKLNVYDIPAKHNAGAESQRQFIHVTE